MDNAVFLKLDGANFASMQSSKRNTVDFKQRGTVFRGDITRSITFSV